MLPDIFDKNNAPSEFEDTFKYIDLRKYRRESNDLKF